MRRVLPVLAATVLSVGILSVAATQAQAAGDAAQGLKVYNKCKICHTVDKGGKNLVGPNLYGIIGRKAATVQGFAYSKSLAEMNITWDEQNLAEYLADPRKFNPGTKMAFVGLKKQSELDDVIAYLKEAATK